MRIFINDESFDTDDSTALLDALKQIDTDLEGSAVAVNQQIISRTNWQDTQLNDGDKVLIFRAIAGG